jgi:hypothetical protein
VRVKSYRATLAFLESKGYSNTAADETKRLRENPVGKAGFPQAFIIDPDRHVIELNAERLDP